MSRIARELRASQKTGPTGRIMCALCEKVEVAPGRRKYCSWECAEAYAISRNPSYARLIVFRRDKGVCAICGFDAVDAILAVEKKRGSIPRGFQFTFDRFISKTFRELGFKRVQWVASEHWLLWDADHITPVIEGGGGCGLENLRTLCCPCHKEVTADLRARLSKGGKKAHQTTLFLALSQSNAPTEEMLKKMMEGARNYADR